MEKFEWTKSRYENLADVQAEFGGEIEKITNSACRHVVVKTKDGEMEYAGKKLGPIWVRQIG